MFDFVTRSGSLILAIFGMMGKQRRIQSDLRSGHCNSSGLKSVNTC